MSPSKSANLGLWQARVTLLSLIPAPLKVVNRFLILDMLLFVS